MNFDCIITLANEMDKECQLNPESVARIRLGVEYFFQNTQSILITCGWNYRKDTETPIGNVMKNFAIELGVPKNNIITELNSRDTVGDAFFTKVNIIEKRLCKDILVVTSDYHVDRTNVIFNFIYGPNYKIHVIGAQGFFNQDKQIQENDSLNAFYKTFKNVEIGNNLNIFTALTMHHPFYNGKIHPKVDSFL